MWNPFKCVLCAEHRETIIFLKNELRMAQEREQQAVNSLLESKGMNPVQVERHVLTDAERKKIQEQEMKAIEDAQALFKDQGTDLNERLVEV